GAGRLQASLEKFKKKATARYNEGTLQRLLNSSDANTRRAATLALGLVGTMQSNAAIALLLHDEDPRVRQLAADALWSLWFRADSDENNAELQRLLQFRQPDQLRAGLDALIARAPDFAEAYNQRAILLFRQEEFQKAIADCERVLKLNPYHFGAQSGLAQCYLNLNKLKLALKAFRKARGIHPTLEGIDEQIRNLESVLGEGGMKDDKK